MTSFFHGEKGFRSFFISFQGTQSIFPYAENSRPRSFRGGCSCDSVLGNAQITVQKLMGLALQQALVQSKDHGVLVGLFDLHIDVGIIQSLGAGLPGPGTGANPGWPPAMIQPRRQAMTSTKS